MQNFIKTVVSALQEWVKHKIKSSIKDSTADWSQNNPGLDSYIKNRTHWEECIESEVVSDQRLTGFAAMENGIYAVVNAISFEPNPESLYRVVWDNKIYDLKIEYSEDEELGYIGNNNYLYMATGGEIPFAIIFAGDIYIVAETTSEAIHTISITQGTSVIHKIDSKYFDLPDNVATVDEVRTLIGSSTAAVPSDWAENITHAPGYIKNRTHWVEPDVKINWDGVIGDKPCISHNKAAHSDAYEPYMFVKVSDETPSDEALRNMYVKTTYPDGTTGTTYPGAFVVRSYKGGMVSVLEPFDPGMNSPRVAVVREPNMFIEDWNFTEPGTYFHICTDDSYSEDVYCVYTLRDIIHTLPSEFLPTTPYYSLNDILSQDIPTNGTWVAKATVAGVGGSLELCEKLLASLNRGPVRLSVGFVNDNNFSVDAYISAHAGTLGSETSDDSTLAKYMLQGVVMLEFTDSTPCPYVYEIEISVNYIRARAMPATGIEEEEEILDLTRMGIEDITNLSAGVPIDNATFMFAYGLAGAGSVKVTFKHNGRLHTGVYPAFIVGDLENIALDPTLDICAQIPVYNGTTVVNGYLMGSATLDLASDTATYTMKYITAG